jgi:hypothetical protein
MEDIVLLQRNTGLNGFDCHPDMDDRSYQWRKTKEYKRKRGLYGYYEQVHLQGCIHTGSEMFYPVIPWDSHEIAEWELADECLREEGRRACGRAEEAGEVIELKEIAQTLVMYSFKSTQNQSNYKNDELITNEFYWCISWQASPNVLLWLPVF